VDGSYNEVSVRWRTPSRVDGRPLDRGLPDSPVSCGESSSSSELPLQPLVWVRRTAARLGARVGVTAEELVVFGHRLEVASGLKVDMSEVFSPSSRRALSPSGPARQHVGTDRPSPARLHVVGSPFIVVYCARTRRLRSRTTTRGRP
jgi:hypothetical protein